MLPVSAAAMLCRRLRPARPRRRRFAGLVLGLLLGAGLPAAAQQPPAGDEEEAAVVEQARVLRQVSASVVGVRALAAPDAASSESLGQVRQGSGVVIDAQGLVLTIGYLVLEADKVDLLLPDGRALPGRVVAYDLATGFALVQPVVPVQLVPAPLGQSGGLDTEEPYVIATGGPDGAMSVAQVVSQRPFSGYWEYHVEDAIFTVPPRPDHSGAGLFNARGELLGIGSLFVMEALGPGRHQPGNMFVPVDLYKAVQDELRRHGASRRSTRAWLGAHCVDHQGLVRVVRVQAGSPAEAAGLQPGDVILKLDGEPVGRLEAFYRRLWSDPRAEREVTLEVGRGAGLLTLTARTADRMKTLRRARGI
ncbi:S1-C subfamily serine protease [Caldimonas thermodepolymerans]|uniref:S1-C subfamily serine protease n=2 Tax=Caldimonas thermodepolymerans TaxID=215580 RepID=A0AA46HVC4_9BURK|nr:S1-C subfamily serine protease [Caldimonas thermodepolymerans]